jgi:hypothetical protein
MDTERISEVLALIRIDYSFYANHLELRADKPAVQSMVCVACCCSR